MNSMTRIAISLLFFGAGMPASLAGTSSSGGTGNPASSWCVGNGGLSVMYQAEGGELGVCQLERALVEEWTFYKATGSNGTTEATLAFIQHAPFVKPASEQSEAAGLPNPASVYCLQVGGALTILRNELGETGFCRFPDKSMIEEWTLFGGPLAAGHARLAHLLGFRSGS